MEIVKVRVDSRGIHGQVASKWIPYTGATRVMVIDDKVVTNETSKMALKLACPTNCKLSILSTQKAADRLSDVNNYIGERIFVLLLNPLTLVTLNELGINFKEVILGNVSNREGSKMITKSVYLLDDEINLLRQLQNNTKLYYQMVPTDSSEEIKF